LNNNENLLEVLEKSDENIINDSTAAMSRFRLKHYDGDVNKFHAKIALLFEHVVRGVREKSVMPMVSYVEQIAEQRFYSGFDLQEVQTAFNILEEHIWKYILEDVPLGAQAEALSLISSIVGSGKDALARTFYQLAITSKN
jgi:hypothetical protein